MKLSKRKWRIINLSKSSQAKINLPVILNSLRTILRFLQINNRWMNFKVRSNIHQTLCNHRQILDHIKITETGSRYNLHSLCILIWVVWKRRKINGLKNNRKRCDRWLMVGWPKLGDKWSIRFKVSHKKLDRSKCKHRHGVLEINLPWID